jgi:hypothetical protein
VETTRTRRIGAQDGRSLYVVERLRPAPTFNRGDGYDGGRNLLGALLIGPCWDTVGYVVGTRGAWHAYTARDWYRHGSRRGLPLCQFGERATVAQAANLLWHERVAA